MDLLNLNIPIIILSSIKGSDEVQRGLSAGANSYMVKPFDPKQWSQLQENMKRGSSKKQIQTIHEAKKRLSKIAKTNF